MRTDDLISLLASDPMRHPRRPLWQVTAVCTGGALLGLIGVIAMGINPKWADSIATPSIMFKFFWLALLVGIAVAGVRRLAHPGIDLGFTRWAWPLAWFGMGVLGMSESLMLKSSETQFSTFAFWMGNSWKTCSIAIAGLSIPLLGTLFWVLRDMAPTQPAIAGGVAGLVAGSITAILYSLHCTETTFGFFALWYGVGIALTGCIGAVCGHRWLRW